MSYPDPRPHLGGDYSGIDPGLMALFEPALGRTGSTMESSELEIRRALQQFDLDTSHLTAFREAANWISAKRPELRRRTETITAEKADWAAPGQAVNRMVAFDEGLYSKTFNDPDVYAATSHLTADGKIGDPALTAFEKRAQDPEFATKLMHALGPETYLALMREAISQGDDKGKRLQAALSKALGAASPRLGDGWRDGLTADLDEREEYFALARALKHGMFDHDFLLNVARKVDSASRTEQNSWFAGQQVRRPLPEAFHQSVMKEVFEALGRHPKAAQEFFVYDPSALRFYVMEKPLKDGGVALGLALEAATMTYRDHAGTALDPSRGYLSAKLASDLVHLQHERLKGDKNPKSLVAAGSIGRILAAYIPDVTRVAATPGPEPSGVYRQDNPNLPGREDWGARFNKTELRAVMQEAFKEDKNAFGVVTAAETAWGNHLLDHGAGQLAGKRGAEIFETASYQVGAAFGLITNAAGLAGIEKGRELDEDQKRTMKILMAAINTGMALPQAGAWPVGAAVIGAWTGTIEDEVKGNAEKDAVFAANNAAEQMRFSTHQLGAQAMFNHGLFGSADPPGKSHPWSSLTDLGPGEDPRSASNNFLKEDGTTLMTHQQMLAGDGSRHDAYRTWLYDRAEDNPWKEQNVQTSFDNGFTFGFADYP
ncbi:hypothetical protein ACIBF7_26890 [Nonomuraea sp. NPDC050478]|uniref:hypothetical protein n=1 Tax=Nonomuraea sp. NPDC050478 TaxID=3364365 RepID=UPI003799D1D0